LATAPAFWAPAIGVDPSRTEGATIEVVEKLSTRTGRKVSDIAPWEINEAFASVPLAACRHFGLNEEIVNVSGSGCSIGHPVAASGSRMIATMIRDLDRRVAVSALQRCAPEEARPEQS
jgi:acetyl-CoA C-acetyltransferase